MRRRPSASCASRRCTRCLTQQTSCERTVGSGVWQRFLSRGARTEAQVGTGQRRRRPRGPSRDKRCKVQVCRHAAAPVQESERSLYPCGRLSNHRYPRRRSCWSRDATRTLLSQAAHAASWLPVSFWTRHCNRMRNMGAHGVSMWKKPRVCANSAQSPLTRAATALKPRSWPARSLWWSASRQEQQSWRVCG